MGGIVTPGILFDVIRKALFRSPSFVRYMKLLTNLQPIGIKDEVRRFRPGLDYSVAYFGAMTTVARLDATLCFVDEKDDPAPDDTKSIDSDDSGVRPATDLWDSGDVGGFECYIEASNEGDSAEAAEVYKGPSLDNNEKKEGDSAEESLLSVSAERNVLSLVMRDYGVMRFVKYVSINAPGSRWDISAEYELDLEEDNDSDE